MHYVEEVHELVGMASRCWNKDGTFDTTSAIEIATRLCEIVRENSQQGTVQIKVDVDMPERKQLRVKLK